MTGWRRGAWLGVALFRSRCLDTLGGQASGTRFLRLDGWCACQGEFIVDKGLAAQVADIAQRVVASGAISANGHGNISVRVPGAEEMYFTAGPPCAIIRPPWWCG